MDQQTSIKTGYTKNITVHYRYLFLTTQWHCLVSAASQNVLLTYVLTYLLTPRCRVLLEKLPGSQIVKKFPAIYGARRFITTFTSTRHLPLSRARYYLSIYAWVSQVVYFLKVFQPKQPYIRPSSSP
jgi:hypothetical protein